MRDNNDDLHGVVQTRLPLRDLKFKRKQRRLLRQNAEHFTVEIGPVHQLTPDFYAVNERYMKLHPDKSVETLWSFVDDGFGNQLLPTHAVEVFRNGLLIAFSFFDPGHRNVLLQNPVFTTPSTPILVSGIIRSCWKSNGPGTTGWNTTIRGITRPLGRPSITNSASGRWSSRIVGTASGNPCPVTIPPTRPTPSDWCVRPWHGSSPPPPGWGFEVLLFEYPSFTARYFHEGDGGNLLDTPLFVRPAGIPAAWPDQLIAYNFHTGEYDLLDYVLSGLRDTRLVVRPDDTINRFPYPVEVTGVRFSSPNPAEIVRALWDKVGEE